jgi:hypothetical protein
MMVMMDKADSQPGGQPTSLTGVLSLSAASHRTSASLSLAGAPRLQRHQHAGFLRGSVWFGCCCSPLDPKRQQVITALAPNLPRPKLPSFPDMRLRPIHILPSIHHSHFILIGRAIADIPTASSKTLVTEF